MLTFDDSRLYDEINVFVELKHKNIIRPLGYCHETIMVLVCHNGKYIGVEEREFCFVEEYMENGRMQNIMNGMLFCAKTGYSSSPLAPDQASLSFDVTDQ
jgi:L1 cell adhesion molecule like protein